MRRKVLSAALVLLTSVALVKAAWATTLTTVLDVQGQGLSIATGGVGLEDLAGGSKNIQVQIDGPVQAAVLYWIGRDFGPVSPTPEELDRDIRFAGVPISGTEVGREFGFGNNIGFAANVTSIVQAAGTGSKLFAFQDNDATKNLDRLNGAGLVVIYTNPADTGTYRIIIKTGLDFAYSLLLPQDGPPSALVTDPVTFNHGAEAGARTAELTLFVGDAEAGRPDRIDISNNPSVVNALDGSQGPEFDVEKQTVNIPAGAANTVVQLFSEPQNQNPDSMLWVLGALRVPLTPTPPPPTGDEGFSPGFWKNNADKHGAVAWVPTGFSPNQTLESVFDMPDGLGLDNQTLLQALGTGGGGVSALMRQAVAAILNAAHPGVDYPLTLTQVVNSVNAALASGNAQTIENLKNQLDAFNNLEGTL